MDASKKTLNCICPKQACWRGRDIGIPEYCQANRYHEELKKATREYSQRDTVKVYKAASIVGDHNQGMTPRIEEALLFAKELKLKRIGFAACVSMVWELGYLIKLFSQEDFEVFTASCQIGRVGAKSRGVPEVKNCTRSWCNPIAQVEILNNEETQ